MVKGKAQHLAAAAQQIRQYSEACQVRCAVATLKDSAGILELNQAFREEMSQWERDPAGVWAVPSYPAVSRREIEDIITEEVAGNLIVLKRVRPAGERWGGKDKAVGYIYSYPEPWGGREDGARTRTRRQQRGSGGAAQAGRPPRNQGDSIYIAELFVVKEERGLGLGEMLLMESLRLRCAAFGRSHLYVSSRNVSAIKCYERFGYIRSDVPSGDKSHDLVMELTNSLRHVTEAAARLEHRLALWQTPPASPSPPHSRTSSTCSGSVRSSPPSPPPEISHRRHCDAVPTLPSRKRKHGDVSSEHVARITRAAAAQLRTSPPACPGSSDEEECGREAQDRDRKRAKKAQQTLGKALTHKLVAAAADKDKMAGARTRGGLLGGIVVIGSSLYRGMYGKRCAG